MAWFIRLEEDADLYTPRFCPDYQEEGFFSIKLHHGGKMNYDPYEYVGGTFDYVDYCHGDRISFLDIPDMLRQLRYQFGAYSIWWKLPRTTMDYSKALHFAGNCEVIWSGDSQYLVTCSEGGHELVVDLERKICTCRKWELTGIPCYHACAVINYKNEAWDAHTAQWYMTENYIKCYSNTLPHVVGPEFWDYVNEPQPLPPIMKKGAWRPKKKRNASKDLPKDPTKLPRKMTIHCSHCKERDHTVRNCQQKINYLKQKAEAEGRDSVIPKCKNTCKSCGQQGHNSRTCQKKSKDAAGGGENTSTDDLVSRKRWTKATARKRVHK